MCPPYRINDRVFSLKYPGLGTPEVWFGPIGGRVMCHRVRSRAPPGSPILRHDLLAWTSSHPSCPTQTLPRVTLPSVGHQPNPTSTVVVDEQAIQTNSLRLVPRTSFAWRKNRCRYTPPSSSWCHRMVTWRKTVNIYHRSPVWCQGMRLLQRDCPQRKRKHPWRCFIRYLFPAGSSRL